MTSNLRRPTVKEIVLSASLLLAVAGCSTEPTTFEQIDAAEQVVADYDYVIHAGAGAEQDAGIPLDILPAEIDATVGQTVQIVNNDDRGHLVGPWFVGAGETLRQTFKSPGEFIGECSVHPSGQIKVTISA